MRAGGDLEKSMKGKERKGVREIERDIARASEREDRS